MRLATIILGIALALMGCSRGAPDLMTFPSREGPNEFLTLPTKPLQTPPDLAALPTPTPGGPIWLTRRPVPMRWRPLAGAAAVRRATQGF